MAQIGGSGPTPTPDRFESTHEAARSTPSAAPLPLRQRLFSWLGGWASSSPEATPSPRAPIRRLDGIKVISVTPREGGSTEERASPSGSATTRSTGDGSPLLPSEDVGESLSTGTASPLGLPERVDRAVFSPSPTGRDHSTSPLLTPSERHLASAGEGDDLVRELFAEASHDIGTTEAEDLVESLFDEAADEAPAAAGAGRMPEDEALSISESYSRLISSFDTTHLDEYPPFTSASRALSRASLMPASREREEAVSRARTLKLAALEEFTSSAFELVLESSRLIVSKSTTIPSPSKTIDRILELKEGRSSPTESDKNLNLGLVKAQITEIISIIKNRDLAIELKESRVNQKLAELYEMIRTCDDPMTVTLILQQLVNAGLGRHPVITKIFQLSKNKSYDYFLILSVAVLSDNKDLLDTYLYSNGILGARETKTPEKVKYGVALKVAASTGKGELMKEILSRCPRAIHDDLYQLALIECLKTGNKDLFKDLALSLREPLKGQFIQLASSFGLKERAESYLT